MSRLLRFVASVSLAVLPVQFATGQTSEQAASKEPARNAASVSAVPGCAAGSEGGMCEVHRGVFAEPLRADGLGHRSLVFHDLTTYGASVNFGNSGGWTISHVIEAPHIVFGTGGIDQYESANVTKNGTGDLAGLYLYVFGGGRSAQSDEGVTGITVESGEIDGYFHGTVEGRSGDELTLGETANAPHGWKYTCAGCMLLDISKGTIAGRLDGGSRHFGDTYLYELPTAGVTDAGMPARLPLTKAWCRSLVAIPATAQAGVGTSRTIDCVLGEVGRGKPGFSAGGVVTIAGPSYPEQARLLATGQPVRGVQSLTILARNPNPAGALIFAGGVAGQAVSFDANLAATGFRTSYYAFGSVDGVHLIYGSQSGGSVLNHQLPRPGAEAEQPDSGFHLYPGAEVVANTAGAASPVLEPNGVAWEVGDTVENPRFQSYGGVGIRDVCRETTPTDQENTSSCMMLEVSGPGVSGTYHPFRIVNHMPLSMYRQGGGVLDAVPAMSLEGAYGDILTMHNGPSRGVNGPGSVVSVANTAAGDGTPFNLFALPGVHGSNATRVTYDPVSLAVGFPGGVMTGSLGTLATCAKVGGRVGDRVDCGAATAGSVATLAGAQSLVVATSAVTASSQILLTADASLSERLGVRCNKDPAVAFSGFGVSARVPGHSFTLTTSGAGPACYSFVIVN